MKPTPDQITAGLKASYALRDSGDATKKLKPISFTGNPTAHVEAIGEAMLSNQPRGALPNGWRVQRESPDSLTVICPLGTWLVLARPPRGEAVNVLYALLDSMAPQLPVSTGPLEDSFGKVAG